MKEQASIVGKVDVETLVALHHGLLKVRLTEETLAERYKEQQMRTPAHFGTGQEAVAVGVCHALRQDDVIFSHHRCHNHYLAKGGDLKAVARGALTVQSLESLESDLKDLIGTLAEKHLAD